MPGSILFAHERTFNTTPNGVENFREQRGLLQDVAIIGRKSLENSSEKRGRLLPQMTYHSCPHERELQLQVTGTDRLRFRWVRRRPTAIIRR